MTVAALIQLLARHRFSFANEAELQTGIADVLTGAGVAYEREVVLRVRDRLDFLCEGQIAIEVKVDGSLADLTRQLSRYVESPRVASVLVVTSRRLHAQMPREMAGKPLVVIVVGGAF